MRTMREQSPAPRAKRSVAAPAPAPHVKVLVAPKGPAYPEGRMLVSSPDEMATVLRWIPRGRVLTLGTLRAYLAARHDADYTCPMSTGLFLRRLANAAETGDDSGAGAVGPIPTWRVVHDDGKLLAKLPGGAERQAALLEGEGVAVKRARVDGLERVAWSPDRMR